MAGAGDTNPAADIDVSLSGHERQQIPPWVALIRKVWPHKTAEHLAKNGNISVRQAYRILAGETGYSEATIRALATTDEGLAALELWLSRETSGEMPAFWHSFKTRAEIEMIDAEIARLRGLKRGRR